jgi:hypothetical protein
MFGLLAAAGANWMTLPPDVLKIVVPSICGEIVGMGFVVGKYLFSVPVRQTLDDLVKDLGSRGLDHSQHK